LKKPAEENLLLMQWGCCKIEFLKTYLIFSGGNHEQTVISTTISSFRREEMSRKRILQHAICFA